MKQVFKHQRKGERKMKGLNSANGLPTRTYGGKSVMNNLKTRRVVYPLFSMVILTGLAFAQLPDPGMQIDPEDTALLITDPQNDFLSPDGVTWGVVGSRQERHGQQHGGEH
jgi:hypothetical protein